MRALFERTENDGIWHHQQNPVRVYAEDAVQADRINRSVKMALKALENSPRFMGLEILELGCGAGDICGALADVLVPQGWVVRGVDCHKESLNEAVRRHPHLEVSLSAIRPILLVNCQMVILCEILEHLTDPIAVAKGVLSKSYASVISHPIDEPVGSQLSGDDHQWSFSLDDHLAFFKIGGHTVDETEIFPTGCYKIALSRGHRVQLKER